MNFPLSRRGFSGYFMGNSRNNQPGRLYTSLVDVGNRVHTRNDSDEDVRGNAYKQTIAWRALPWSFIIQTFFLR